MNSRAKGSGFERQVAKLVVGAFRKAGYKVSSKDCYRTPLSGGHRFSRQTDPGDLMMTRRMQALFPFVVECKFHKKFSLYRFLVAVRKRKSSWHEFKFIAQAHQQARHHAPLLVAKGNNTPIFALLPLGLDNAVPEDRKAYSDLWKHEPRISIPRAVVDMSLGIQPFQTWSLILFEDFLQRWTQHVPKRRQQEFKKRCKEARDE
jgi:hypothetical protein